jgi:hypothetical protein
MDNALTLSDRLGLLHPAVDVHTLGISALEQLLSDCGLTVTLAPPEVNEAAGSPSSPSSARILRDWVKGRGITALGFSYRLDPEEGRRVFAEFLRTLTETGLLAAEGGPVHALLFAGLPLTCDLVGQSFPGRVTLFRGEEGPAEILDLLGLPRSRLPAIEAQGIRYDEDRLAFGRVLVAKGEYLGVGPVDRRGYRHYGERGDGIAARVDHGTARGLPPVIRAHVGPYLSDRREARALFLDWTRRLAQSGLLDVLSIGTSQLSQEAFGEDWEGRADGGGVPLATPEDFAEVWRAARPMLVRSYAGTKGIEAMARMFEERIDMAWHALSFWWFCALDGRGPNPVLANLREHLATLAFIAGSDKPFEPNVPHHFAFRGADDLSYVLSGLVAAKAAKAAGVRRLILQVMLNTPRSTWGLADLAKARALLHLVRELEDGDFKVYLQPRGGLDYFSRDSDTAKAQLAAVTALMDDIEPHDPTSPPIIHVVSHSEGYALADPAVVDESIRITRYALAEYRRLRESGLVEDMASNAEVLARTSALLRDARAALEAIETSIARPYCAEGLYEILASGFFALPYLAECREEFAAATRWKTKAIAGSIVVVDERGRPVAPRERLALAAETARSRAGKSAAGLAAAGQEAAGRANKA